MAGGPLAPDQVAIIKATVPVLKQYGSTITTAFYANMLAAHPELNNIFSHTAQTTGRQSQALASAVLAYATFIDDLPKLQHAVERIAHKHVSLQVQPEQYAIVGEFLIGAIRQVLGDAATPEIVEAWTSAYQVLAEVFIGREAQMYAQNEEEHWVGWRKVRVARREKETEGIVSLYLEPVDGGDLPKFLPGQYVSLRVFVPELGYMQCRQYSLSEAWTDGTKQYRISVKRDDGECGTPGVISNMLHSKWHVGDEIEISHPQGEFVVDSSDETKEGAPAVLISVGVGATPLVAILESLTAEKAVKRPVTWIQGASSCSNIVFENEVKQISAANPTMKRRIFVRNACVAACAGALCKAQNSRVDLESLDAEAELFLGNERAEYFVCGPEDFMITIRRFLMQRGVKRDRVYLELFATGDVPE